MSRIVLRRWLPLLVAVVGLVFSGHAQEQGRGRKYKPPPATCKIIVTVTKANGKPLENASVVFHPLENGKDKGNMELKTNEDGKVTIDVIPMGDQLRLQVLAEGYQTFGNDYDLPTDTKEIAVKMNRPQKQYSIYESHSGNGSQQGQTQSQDGSKPQPDQKPQ